MQVKKRDGQIEDFEITKVEKAILKAARKVKEQLTDDILDKLKSYVLKKVSKLEEPIEILDIQKATEEALMKYNLFEVATEFHDYRQERDRVRFEKFTIIQEMEEKLSASNVQNQNANVDEHSFGGRKGEASSSMLKKLALDYMISPKFAKNHKNFVGYIHDLDSYRVGEHNCLSVPIDDLCDRPVTVKNPKDIRASQGIASFGEQVLVHIQSQSLMQFGGVSVTHLDWSSVPYMRASFWKRYQSAIEAYKAFTGETIENPVAKEDRKEVSITDKRYKANKKIWDIAYKELVKESDQAAEALIHNLGTLMSRSGNQLPFSSINYGTCTLEEGRVFSKSLLKTWDRGIGELGLTPIFPCGIFQYKKGVNDKPGTPNYDLKKEAIRVLVKRDYPNFANCDWSVQHKAFEQSQAIKKKVLTNLDKETFEKVGKLPIKIQERLGFTVDSKSGLVEMNKTEQPYEMMSTMGALAGHEHLYIKIADEIFDISIKDLFEYSKTGELKNARPAKLFFNKARVSKTGDKHIQEKSGIKVGSGVYSITYLPEDVTYFGSSENVCRRWAEHKSHIKLSGGLDAGPSFGDTDLSHYKFEVLEYTEDYQEAEKHYIEKCVNINLKGTNQLLYKKLNFKGTNVRPEFKKFPVPQELINLEDKDIKVFDINNNWVKIRHIFKNDKLNTPLMMRITYQENGKTYSIYATEDHPFFNGKGFTRADELKVGDKLYRADDQEMGIIYIEWCKGRMDSYDIGTESGTFVGSDIKMHNCRTYNGFDINFTEEYFEKVLKRTVEAGSIPNNMILSGIQKDGRGNIAPCTIVLPFVAMEAKKKAKENPEYVVDYFMDLLEKYIGDAKDELIERFNWIAAQPASSAKYMYNNNTMKGYEPEEGIRSALIHGTLAIGSLGTAEACTILLGEDQTTEKGMELAKKIEELYNSKCNEYKHNYKLNFGNYKTPAENLCFTSFKAFKKKYGVVPGVTNYTDKDGNVQEKLFFTNSFHIPVWKGPDEGIDWKKKIDLESQLTGYTNAGCITYLEISDSAKNNLEGIEQILDYEMGKDIPYAAFNFNINECTECGSTDVDDEACKCRVCGSTKINWLARITGYINGNYLETFNLGKQDEKKKRVKHC